MARTGGLLALGRRALPAAALLGCAVGGGAKAYPLYMGAPRADQDVALLVGQIAAVDGVSVSDLGDRFAVGPGCHVLRIPSRVYDSDGQASMVGRAPPAHFSLQTKAGHLYHVRVKVGMVSGAGSAALTIEVLELDAARQAIGQHPALPGEGSVEQCEAEASFVQARLGNQPR